MCSEWVVAREEVSDKRVAFHTTHMGRRWGHMQIQYSLEMVAIYEYKRWLQTRMRGDLVEGRPVDDMTIVLANHRILTF